MKKRKFKILKVTAKDVEKEGKMVTFHTKVGPFRYLLSNRDVLQRFLNYNPNLLQPRNKNPCSDLNDYKGKFLFVPERSK